MNRIKLPDNLIGKKIISFSLYGGDPLYTIGAIKNAKLAKIYFPEWIVVVFYDYSVNDDILTQLKDLNVELINVDWSQGLGRFWRFIPASENVEYFISRDTDSRLFERDRVAVNEWIESGKQFHIIREHPIGHHWEMNAGMWGCKGNSVNDIQSEIVNYSKNFGKFTDQYFLTDIIYPIAVKDSLVHDEFCNYPNENKTNIKRDRSLDDFSIIGEVFNHEDIPMGDQRTPIINIYNNR